LFNNRSKKGEGSLPDSTNKLHRAATRFRMNSTLPIILILIAPTLFTLIAYPSTFGASWNQGRGGFLFSMALIAAELIGLHYNISRKKSYILICLSLTTIAYFIVLPLGLRDLMRNSASYYRVQLIDSWEWMWDFVIMSLFVVSSLRLLFGRNWYKVASAGAIYLVGSAIILSLDAFFPFDTLGPLQFIVPGYLQVDQIVVRFIGSHIMNLGTDVPATAHGNLLLLNGLNGPFAIKVFWPSAGVHSMIIYSLVMLAFLLKMDIPLQRKAIYFIIGTIGTAAVNLIRIISLSLFALIITTNVNQWEEFHSLAGEIMFLPWLGIYLFSIIFIENKLAKLSQRYLVEKAASQTERSSPSATSTAVSSISEENPLDSNHNNANGSSRLNSNSSTKEL
jgi:thaumarchaeosortase